MKNCDFVYDLFSVGYDFDDIYGAFGDVCFDDNDDNDNNDDNNNNYNYNKKGDKDD